MRENEGRALIRDFSFRSLHANWHFFSTGRSRLRFVSTFGIHMAYYLTDDIYPKWTTFIQSIRLPQGPKNSLFAKSQEAVRKDVERAFGVLQARFAVVKNPSKLWDKYKISNIMRAYIILHNMIVEDKRASFTQYNAFEFQEREDEDSFSVNMPSHLGNTMDR